MTGSHDDMETLPLFARFLTRSMGLHFPHERLPELEQKMAHLCREQGHPDLGNYLIRLMSSPLSQEQIDTLARALTIGETYFLRDPKSYQLLEEQLLPELVAARRSTDKTIRIWSAGCSSGEEPYTIAILLSRAIPDLATWKITLIASDINPQALERGRLGIYSKWSFRNAPPWLFEYFTEREDGRFELVPHIRKMVRFRNLNLADPPKAFATGDHFKGMDIIFCRNVMLYFDAAQIEKTMARFHAALSDTGWLFVGPTEVDHTAYRGFSCRLCDGTFVLRKGTDQQEASEGPELPILPPYQPAAASAEQRAFSCAVDQPPALAAPRSETVPLAAAAPLPVVSAFPEQSRSDETPAPGYKEAEALYQAGRYQQAAELALSSLDAVEEQADALALGARAYANIGRFAEARDCCEKAIAHDRLNPQNHYLLSIILEQQGETEGAAKSLKHALFIDHDYLLAYFALGNLYRQCGDQRESERNFANALRLLERRHPHEVLPEAEGMTAGRLAEVIRAMTVEAGARDRG